MNGKKTCYDKLKINYFEKGICKINGKKDEIFMYMAFLYSENNFIKQLSFDIESLSYDKLKDFYVKNNMVLISKDLYKLMNDNKEKEGKKISFKKK